MPATTIADYDAAQPDAVRPICEALGAAVISAAEKAEGRIWHGHPVWMIGSTPVVGYKASAKAVSFLVWRGQELETIGLTATGSFAMGTAKFASIDAIDPDVIRVWTMSAEALES